MTEVVNDTPATVELPTEEEQENILRTAIGLILEPDSWTPGTWKCEARDLKSGEQKFDANGKPLYQYCIQGALNQATYDVLGEGRALELGAVNLDPNGGINFNNGDSPVGYPAHWLGVDEVAAELYDLEALSFNDSLDLGDLDLGGGEEYDPETVRDHPRFLDHHQGVLHILRTKLNRLTGKEDG